MQDKVRRAIERYHLVACGEVVVVGVSGGPDSLCLLHVLCRLSEKYRLAVHVAHLHHGLRGEDADADANFVQTLAREWGLPCALGRADVAALAREHRLAIEEAARRARYAFLCEVAEGTSSKAIAVAHTADDQTETVLMRWIRGSGPAGLRGMLPVTPMEEYRLIEPLGQGGAKAAGLRLIRPLLEVERREVEAYCARYGLEPRFDRSNLDTTHFRNWLRRDVIPLLAGHNPRIHEVIRRSAQVIAEDYDLLRSLLEANWPRVVVEEMADSIRFDLVAWRELPVSLQRSILREAVRRLRRNLRDIDFAHVENALSIARDGNAGKRATLPRGLMLAVGHEDLRVADADQAETLPDWPLLPREGKAVPVTIPGLTQLPDSDWAIEIAFSDREHLPVAWEQNTNPWLAYLDACAGQTGLWLRQRQTGDRFRPLGMGSRTAKLSDFLTNQKVPKSVRDRLPLLVNAQGIVWVCGYRIDECVRVGVDARQVLVCRFVRA